MTPRSRSGEPAPENRGRERFERMLAAAECLGSSHIHEAPYSIVPCLEGGPPDPDVRLVKSLSLRISEHAAEQTPALGLGATLTTLCLPDSRRKQEAALGFPTPDGIVRHARHLRFHSLNQLRLPRAPTSLRHYT